MNTKLLCSKVISESNITFGTSGARGLVADFTPEVCASFSIAFLKTIDNEFSFRTVALAIDNRPSSYAIAQACAEGIKQLGLGVVFYGVLPTPALAYKAMQDNMPSIMITGSHIPFDRNGLKFYTPKGEITKADELAILSNNSELSTLEILPKLSINEAAEEEYIKRYTDLFNSDALVGKKIGIYEHSSAGRDIYKSVFEHLGAEVISIGRSDNFVPIDTEAVSNYDKEMAVMWSKEYGFDAIFSTDGDGDRPLISDENGNWLRGDILGLLCSQLLNVNALAVPISCNTAIELTGSFKKVIRTKIGSPYVIAEFAKLSNENFNFAGFEANGGYLLGSDISVNGKVLKALPTRDALLPAFMLLSQKEPISKQLEKLPQRFTASDRLQNLAEEESSKLVSALKKKTNSFLANIGYDQSYELDTTDGLRIILEYGDIVHLRPSGNAPELRCYTESDSEVNALNLLRKALDILEKRF